MNSDKLVQAEEGRQDRGVSGRGGLPRHEFLASGAAGSGEHLIVVVRHPMVRDSAVINDHPNQDRRNRAI
jgi:hypothetical protein